MGSGSRSRSWGFANTGTRFGKFVQAGAATSLEEKFEDAGQVNKLTGASPTVALHVLWDLPNGKGDVPELRRLEKKYGVKSGAVNPNLFQDQEYKYGSIAHPSAEIRKPRAGASAGFGGDRQGAGKQGRVDLAGRWIELSGDAVDAQADRVAGGGAGGDPRGAGPEPADAGGVQAV